MGEFKMPDISNLENSLRQKIHELQWKTDALDKAKIELIQTRQTLYNERMILEKERGRFRELEIQLKGSYEIVEVLEKEKLIYQQERIQLQANSQTAMKERDSLLNQARNAKIENITLNSKIQQLEEEISKKEAFGKGVGSSLEQLKDDMTKLNRNLQSNVSKLEREQEYLRQSVKVITTLNHRLIVMGMCAHIEHRKQNEMIKELQTRLNELSTKDVEQLDEFEKSIDLSKLQIILNENKKSDSDEELDRQVEEIISELQNVED